MYSEAALKSKVRIPSQLLKIAASEDKHGHFNKLGDIEVMKR